MQSGNDVQPLSPEYLERLRALVEKATPGPWEADSRNAGVGRAITVAQLGLTAWRPANDNQAFVAESRTAVPLLLGEVARLREALERCRVLGAADLSGGCDSIEDEHPRLEDQLALIAATAGAALDGVKGETR